MPGGGLFGLPFKGCRVQLSGGSPACVLDTVCLAVIGDTQMVLAKAPPATSTGVTMTVSSYQPHSSLMDSTAIAVRGDHLEINVDTCQEEAVANFIKVTVGQTKDSINISHSLIQSIIQLTNSCKLNLKGNRMFAQSIRDASGALSVVSSDGDTFRPNDALTHALTYSGHEILLADAQIDAFNYASYTNVRNSVSSYTDTIRGFSRFILSGAFFSSLLKGVMELGSRNAGQTLLKLGLTDENDEFVSGATFSVLRGSFGECEINSDAGSAANRKLKTNMIAQVAGLQIGFGTSVYPFSKLSYGSFSLIAGAATVPETNAFNNSIIILTPQTGANSGYVAVVSRSNGVSFGVQSSNSSDDRAIGYICLTP